jgi:hypothetical protein
MFLSEPTTTLTDYVMAAIALVQALALARAARHATGEPRPAVGLYVTGFLIAALASFLGGTSHGFRSQLGEYWSPVWSATVATIIIAFILIIAAGVRSSLRPQVLDAAMRHRGRKYLAFGFGLTGLGLAAMVAKISFHQHFNQNDLYHVIQWFGMYFVYRGGRTLCGLDERRV